MLKFKSKIYGFFFYKIIVYIVDKDIFKNLRKIWWLISWLCVFSFFKFLLINCLKLNVRYKIEILNWCYFC